MKENYIPYVIEDNYGNVYALFMVSLNKCQSCQKPTIRRREDWIYELGDNEIERQAKRANIGLYSQYAYLCDECIQAGRGEFTCDLCGKKYPLKELQEKIGCDHLGEVCATCYKTKTAEMYHKEIDEYKDRHMWDCN